MFRWIANRTILAPTTDRIATEGMSRLLLDFDHGQLEVWCQRNFHSVDSPTALIVLKFPGMAGRAENARLHPLDIWDDLPGEVWAVNPPGYGGSTGPATVASLPKMAMAVWNHVKDRHPQARVIVSGNSLGSCSALFLAAHQEVDGLLIRNPTPISDLIRERWRYNWWNLGAGKWVAANFPDELNPVGNAPRCRCPAVFIQSGADRLVPVEFQDRILSRYAGPKRLLILPEADHHTPMGDSESADYLGHLTWLKSQII